MQKRVFLLEIFNFLRRFQVFSSKKGCYGFVTLHTDLFGWFSFGITLDLKTIVYVVFLYVDKYLITNLSWKNI